MAVANTLAYCDTATITVVKSLKVYFSRFQFNKAFWVIDVKANKSQNNLLRPVFYPSLIFVDEKRDAPKSYTLQ
jgi:hypothetical protein